MTIEDYLGEKVEYSPEGQMVFGVNSQLGAEIKILDVRGWGAICNHFTSPRKSQIFQDSVGEWIVEAINEKLARED